MSKKKKKKQPYQKGQFTQTWGYVYPYFKEYRKNLAVVVFLSFCGALFNPSVAVIVGFSFKMMRENLDFASRHVYLFPITIVAMFTYRAFFNFSSKYLLEKVCLRVVRNIQNALYEHYMFLSLDHYERTTTGEMMSRTVNDVQHMQRVVPMVIDIVQNIFSLISLVAVCFYMEPYLSILAIFAFPLTVYPVQVASTRMRRYTKKSLKETAIINTMMQETYSGAKVVKAFAMEKNEVSRYKDVMQRLLKIQYKYAAVKQAISPLLGVIASVGIAPIAYFAAVRVIETTQSGSQSVDNLAAYVVAAALMFDPIRKMGLSVGHLSSAYGATERIRETFDKQSTVVEPPDAVELPPMRESIEYRGVSFRYTDETVLHDFNLKAQKGQLVALVGISGSGKSTVVNLLPRFYDVTEGMILIDGQDITKATLRSLRMQIGVVTQETFLFDGTVASNILYGSEGKTIDDVIKVAKAAKVHDFVSKLPDGYDTQIGERGVRMSGGERQRIAIARALLKDPPILLLDEATSALDTAAEREVQAALDSLMANRTTIAIAHRLSTITHADKIVVIKKGRIAETGTHEELMSREGEYKRLYEMQFFLGDYSTDHYRARQREGKAGSP